MGRGSYYGSGHGVSRRWHGCSAAGPPALCQDCGGFCGYVSKFTFFGRMLLWPGVTKFGVLCKGLYRFATIAGTCHLAAARIVNTGRRSFLLALRVALLPPSQCPKLEINIFFLFFLKSGGPESGCLLLNFDRKVFWCVFSGAAREIRFWVLFFSENGHNRARSARRRSLVVFCEEEMYFF